MLTDEHVPYDKLSVNSPLTIYRQEFITNANTTFLNNILNKVNLSTLNLYKHKTFKHNYLFPEESMNKNSIYFDSTSLLKVFLFDNAENSHPRIKLSNTIPSGVRTYLKKKIDDDIFSFWMVNNILPGNGPLKKELFFNTFKY